MSHIRIRDLPMEERAPFSRWLNRQACPVLPDVSEEEQDAAYVWDYERWLVLRHQPAPERPQSDKAEKLRGRPGR